MSNNTFTTDVYLPTLEAVDQTTAKKLKEMCNDMEGLMINTNNKISTLLQNQSNSFFKAFKIVVEQMSIDFKTLQQKFEEYIAYHENETEVVNAQNKLAFFRNECSLLSKLCIDLKNENSELKQKVKDLEQEVNNHKIILLKQIGKNSKLYDQIQSQKMKLNAQKQPMYISVSNPNAYQSTQGNQDFEIKLKVPSLKLQNRFHTDATQDYDQPSISTYSNKHHVHQIQKEKLLKKHYVTLNKTSDDILETASRKQKQFGINYNQLDKFYEKSYESRTKSQQQTLKKLEQTETVQKNSEVTNPFVKNIQTNPKYVKQNPTISA